MVLVRTSSDADIRLKIIQGPGGLKSTQPSGTRRKKNFSGKVYL